MMPLRRQRLGPHRVAHLRGEQLRPEPALALARGQDDLAEVRLEVGQRGPGRLGGRTQPRTAAAATAGSAGARRRPLASASSIKLADPRQLLERVLGLEPPDRAAGMRPRASRARPR